MAIENSQFTIQVEKCGLFEFVGSSKLYNHLPLWPPSRNHFILPKIRIRHVILGYVNVIVTTIRFDRVVL